MDTEKGQIDQPDDHDWYQRPVVKIDKHETDLHKFLNCMTIVTALPQHCNPEDGRGDEARHQGSAEAGGNGQPPQSQGGGETAKTKDKTRPGVDKVKPKVWCSVLSVRHYDFYNRATRKNVDVLLGHMVDYPMSFLSMST